MLLSKARPSASKSLSLCPKGHRFDSPSAKFCPKCGLPRGGEDDSKRTPQMVRSLPSSQAKFQLLVNHLSHGHIGRTFEEMVDFTSAIVNGKISSEELRELTGPLAKLVKRTYEIMAKENADFRYALTKAAKELGEPTSEAQA